MIEIKELTKKYQKKTDTLIALNNISYCFKNKGLYFITGKSGSGKSTLLNLLSGIDFNYEGEILIEGKSLKSFNKKELNYYRSSYIGYIFQNYNLMSDLTVYENVKLGFDISGNLDEKIIEEVLEKLKISNLRDRRINEISGGEAQRVAICRCLVKKPKVIIADEPTGALDNNNSKLLFDILNDLSKEITIIVASHNEDLISKYDATVINVDEGVIDNNTFKNTNDEYLDFLPSKYKGLSNKILRKLGFELISSKKISLIISSFILVLLSVFISVSVSVVNYNRNKVFFDKLVDENSIGAIRNNYNVSTYSNPGFTDKILYECETELGDKFAYSYRFDVITKNDIDSIAYYYDETCNYYCEYGTAFEYNEVSKELFDLNIILGKEPSNDLTEIVITNTLANYFIENNYYNGYKIDIDKYEDLIGLTLFDYNIVGIVSYTNEKNYLKALKKDDLEYIEKEIYSGCPQSIFVGGNLKKKYELKISTKYINKNSNEYILDNNEFIISKNNIDFYNVIFASEKDKNSNGTIISSNYICELVYNMDFKSYKEELYNTYRNMTKYDKLSDDELVSYIDLQVKNDLINKITYDENKKNINFIVDLKNGPNGNSVNYYSNVIGIDFEDTNVFCYYDENELENHTQEIQEYYVIDAIHYKIKDNKKCRTFTYKILNNTFNNESDVPKLYLSDYIISEIYSYKNSTFNMMVILFSFMLILFLVVAFFILFKYIYDSIRNKKKEIGFLKSIGVSNADLYKIFNIENMFFSILILVFTLMLQYIGVYLMNIITSNLYKEFIESYTITWKNYIVIILFAIIIPILASIYPILKFSKKNAKDAINDN